MATLEITTKNLQDIIEKNDIVFLDFWADWCPPCRAFGPVFEAASREHPEMVFGKVDTESQPALAAAFKITSIPTLVAFRGGKQVFAQPGALNAQGLGRVIAEVAQ